MAHDSRWAECVGVAERSGGMDETARVRRWACCSRSACSRSFRRSQYKDHWDFVGREADDPLGNPTLRRSWNSFASFGWVESRTVRFEQRWASGDPAVMRKGAQELEALAPSAILAVTAPSALILKNQTRLIPIVFVLVIDAIALGLVSNLAKPERNITGFTNFEPSMGSKWLELLKEMAPNVRRVGCMLNPN